MPETLTNLQKAQLYLKSIEQGTFPGKLLAPNILIEQLPNRIYPKGIRAGVEQMSEAFKKGKQLLESRTYEIKNAVENGDRVALEVLSTGKLAVPFGSLKAGDEMRAHSAMFLAFENGKIVAQRNSRLFRTVVSR